MKWLTIEEIRIKSQTPQGALEVSYEHWNQLYRATQKELREAYRTEKIYITHQDCGLCIRYFDNDCRKCPLRSCKSDRTLYRKAKNVFNDWLDKSGTWHTWKRTAKALRDKLKELME